MGTHWEHQNPNLPKGKTIEPLGCLLPHLIGCKGICVYNKGVLHPTKLREIPNWG